MAQETPEDSYFLSWADQKKRDVLNVVIVEAPKYATGKFEVAFVGLELNCKLEATHAIFWQTIK